MGKFKPVKKGKGKRATPSGAVPCVMIVLLGILLLSLLFWAILRSS
jgi:hypothetical protein